MLPVEATRRKHARTALQDSKFTDVAATSLFWSNGGQVVVDGLTYRNVTTADVQWDASGTVVVPGNGELIVRELDTSQVAAGSLDAPGSVQQVAPLKPDDAWLTAVKQVRHHLKSHVLGD